VTAGHLVEIAAGARDGPALLEGWQSYYSLLTDGGRTSVLASARDTLLRLLPGWTHSTDTRARRLGIVHALAGSRFFSVAAYLARVPLSDGSILAHTDVQTRKIVAYADFLEQVRRTTDEYYRLLALDRADRTSWQQALDSAERALWPYLVSTSRASDFSNAAFEKEAERQFGLIINVLPTAGFPNAHIGHIVEDERHRVTQWGHSADFRFIELDQLVSNGFTSWFGDGRLADGGFTNPAMVVQIRPSYTLDPSTVWESLTNPVERAALDSSIAADSTSDVVRARATPMAYFPSVPRRLDRAGELALLDSLRASGDSASLRRRFVEALASETRAFSIFAHEGRHAIDQAMAREGAPPVEAEFTAKLAQVEFGPRPETAFRGIMTASVGDKTPHGRADSHVLNGLAAWMTAHTSEIPHLDPSAAMLPQIPLLRGDQLRAAFRGMDPLAQASTRSR
jgi:hypothetical protein